MMKGKMFEKVLSVFNQNKYLLKFSRIKNGEYIIEHIYVWKKLNGI